jgi:hypothetical protein
MVSITEAPLKLPSWLATAYFRPISTTQASYAFRPTMQPAVVNVDDDSEEEEEEEEEEEGEDEEEEEEDADAEGEVAGPA